MFFWRHFWKYYYIFQSTLVLQSDTITAPYHHSTFCKGRFESKKQLKHLCYSLSVWVHYMVKISQISEPYISWIYEFQLLSLTLALVHNAQNFDQGIDYLWTSLTAGKVHCLKSQGWNRQISHCTFECKHGTYDSLLANSVPVVSRYVTFSPFSTLPPSVLHNIPHNLRQLLSFGLCHVGLLFFISAVLFEMFFSPAIFLCLPCSLSVHLSLSPLRAVSIFQTRHVFSWSCMRVPGEPGCWRFWRWRPLLFVDSSWDRPGEGGSKAHMYTNKRKRTQLLFSN